MGIRKSACVWVAGLALLASAARGEVFELTINGTSDNLNAQGNSLPDLVEDVINRQGQFETFENQAFNSSLKYGGVENAILLDSNAAGTSATLTIPSTGFQRTFTGATSDDVQNQIEDFLLKEGNVEYAKFLEQINQQSLLGVVDGNPRATTALMSDHAFRTFGLNRSPMQIDLWPRGGIASNLRFDFEGGVTDNDEADETYFQGAIGTGFAGKNFGITLTTIGQYRDVDGSTLFSVGQELGLPIALIPYVGDRGFSWTLTPTGIVAAGASYDLAAGGTMWGVGLTSSLQYHYEGWIFTLANHIQHYEGFSIDIGEYEFDTQVSQQVVKNGVSIARVIGRGFVDVGVAYTNFLQDSFIDGYFTPTVGAGIRFGEASGLRVGYKGDFGDDYTSHGGEVTLYFGF